MASKRGAIDSMSESPKLIVTASFQKQVTPMRSLQNKNGLLKLQAAIQKFSDSLLIFVPIETMRGLARIPCGLNSESNSSPLALLLQSMWRQAKFLSGFRSVTATPTTCMFGQTLFKFQMTLLCSLQSMFQIQVRVHLLCRAHRGRWGQSPGSKLHWNTLCRKELPALDTRCGSTVPESGEALPGLLIFSC